MKGKSLAIDWLVPRCLGLGSTIPERRCGGQPLDFLVATSCPVPVVDDNGRLGQRDPRSPWWGSPTKMPSADDVTARPGGTKQENILIIWKALH